MQASSLQANVTSAAEGGLRPYMTALSIAVSLLAMWAGLCAI
jgi:hypothetical protein